MKVLLVNTALGASGGIATYGRQLVDCLSEDTELTVISGIGKQLNNVPSNVKILVHDVELLSIENSLFFINIINNEIKPDVVIASKATIIPVIAPYLNDSIKVITVSHSGKYFQSDYCAVNHHYLDRIIAASSDYNKKYLEKKFHITDKEKIAIIYNFMASDNVIEGFRNTKRDQKPIRIVYAGSTSVNKSPDLVTKIILELIKTKLDFRFYWTGAEPTIPLTTTVFKHSKLKTVKQIIPKDERLVFPGRIEDKREFDMLMGSANIQLAPSSNEGCSMALLEGHRAGSIFIVADYENSNREIVSKAGSGFVLDHHDVSAFVNTIINIIEEPSKYHDLYEKSHEAFVKMLSYPIWRQQLFEVLNSPTNHKKRKNKISKLGLIISFFRMKMLWYSSLVSRFLCLSLPLYISFHIIYRKEKKKLKNVISYTF